MNKDLKKKITAYSALAGAVAAGGVQEVEAQIIYVDIPDRQICQSFQTTNNTTQSYSAWDEKYFFLDMDGQAYSTLDNFIPNPDAEVMFMVVGYVDNNRRLCVDDDAWAWAYAYDGYWNETSMFMGTSVNGYIKNMNLGSYIGPGVQRANASWGIIPVIGYSEQCYNGTFTYKSTFIYGDPNWVNDTPVNQVSGYLGVAFDIGGKTHYGWIQIQIDQEARLTPGVVGSPIVGSSCITILDYAYNSVPDRPISAGLPVEPVTIPTLSQWGLILLNLVLLIFGAVAIRREGRVVVEKKV